MLNLDLTMRGCRLLQLKSVAMLLMLRSCQIDVGGIQTTVRLVGSANHLQA